MCINAYTYLYLKYTLSISIFTEMANYTPTPNWATGIPRYPGIIGGAGQPGPRDQQV